jgi:putative addiction module CopG family antidote
MPTDPTRNVSLKADLNTFLRAQVASGQYRNASAAIRAGLRLLQKRQQRDERKNGAPAPNGSYAR